MATTHNPAVQHDLETRVAVSSAETFRQHQDDPDRSDDGSSLEPDEPARLIELLLRTPRLALIAAVDMTCNGGLAQLRIYVDDTQESAINGTLQIDDKSFQSRPIVEEDRAFAYIAGRAR